MHARSFGSPCKAYRPVYQHGRGYSLQVQASSSKTVPVTVSLTKKVDFGETFKLVGNQPFLGDWDPQQAAPLQWGDGHVWSTTLQVPVGVDVAFKVIRAKDDGSAVWEKGNDRKFKALGPDYSLHLAVQWDDTSSTKITSEKLDGSSQQRQSTPAPRQGTPPPKASSGGASDREGSPAGTATFSRSSMEEEARATGAWVGGGPEFVRSRPDKGSRSGVWRTEGLPPLEADLVRGDEKASNWLGKLGLMKDILVDKPARMRPGVEELSACYVYATWINTGAIRCVETGGHHRPNHHANAALQMFRSLEWAISDAGMGEGASAQWPAEARILAARRMHTRLPSISGEFRVSTPLTRIRDIAHRNDIPKPLKDEIKHTLQNKLHRSAGPEDLVATEAMLARITAKPGEYSEGFVEEFKRFTKELREFFNASGLVDLLEQTSNSMDDNHRAIANQFKAAMSRLGAADNAEPSMDDLMAALFMGTQTRGYFASGLSAGLRNDVQDEVLAMRQRWRLAEIRIEEYMFVLLARIIGQLEKGGGAAMMAKPGSSASWRVAVGALINGLRQLGLSGYATRELLALDNELEAWLAAYTSSSSNAASQREAALRGKACVERVLRLASQYSDLVMSVYVEPASRLGGALGVPEHMAHIFGESEVRASVAFQVSRLAGLVSQALRMAAGMDAWDPLVTGDALGRLVEVDSLSPEVLEQAGKDHQEDMVLLVRRAEGDEEIGSLGSRLAGVVLCQELPHLSHLGVRARQEKVVFAMCDDKAYVDSKVRPLLGQHVQLSVQQGSVSLRAAQPAARATKAGSVATQATHYGNGNGTAASSGASQGSVAAIRKASRLDVVPLLQATVETCGSKAAKCADLERLSQDQATFSTPQGVVLPFGGMEAALKEERLTNQFQELVSKLDQPDLSGQELDVACERMADLLRSLTLPTNLLNKISGSFPGGTLLAVRSSANVEDLSGMSAAGLYDSKVGVPAGDAEAVRAAVTEVWASLFSRRAVLSRRAARVPQQEACMAVLIMELVAPEVSFVLHTARPNDGNQGVLLAELAPGQGETLASGTRGTPWRLEVDKASKRVNTLAFANFSRALVLPAQARGGARSQVGLKYSSFDELHGAGGNGSTATASPPRAASPSEQASTSSRAGLLVEVEVDYSKQRLSVDPEYRSQVGKLLCEVGQRVEASYGGQAQDIEGGLLPPSPGSPMPRLVVFQTRPQH